LGHVPTQKCQKIRLETILKNLGQNRPKWPKFSKIAKNGPKCQFRPKLCGIDENTSDLSYIPKSNSEIPTWTPKKYENKK